MKKITLQLKKFSEPLEAAFVSRKTKNRHFRQREFFREAVRQILLIKFTPRKKDDLARFKKQATAILEVAWQKSQSLSKRFS